MFSNISRYIVEPEFFTIVVLPYRVSWLKFEPVVSNFLVIESVITDSTTRTTIKNSSTNFNKYSLKWK